MQFVAFFFCFLVHISNLADNLKEKIVYDNVILLLYLEIDFSCALNVRTSVNQQQAAIFFLFNKYFVGHAILAQVLNHSFFQ